MNEKREALRVLLKEICDDGHYDKCILSLLNTEEEIDTVRNYILNGRNVSDDNVTLIALYCSNKRDEIMA